MTKLWKRIAVGAAVVGAVAATGLLWGPTRTAVASMMGTGMMRGGMAQMMASHMQGGDMAAMMESHMKSGNMAAMMGSDMMENMDEMHAAMPDFHRRELEVAAKTLGISTDDLSKALSDGQEIAEIAKERNLDPALVSSALEELRQSTLADLVTAGTLTQEQADLVQEHMKKIGTDTLKFGTMMQTEGHCQAQKFPAN